MSDEKNGLEGTEGLNNKFEGAQAEQPTDKNEQPTPKVGASFDGSDYGKYYGSYSQQTPKTPGK